MKDLKYYQKIIQDKRKQTEFRDFLMEIASWYSMMFYKHTELVSKFPLNFSGKKIIPFHEFDASSDNLIQNGIEYSNTKTFFQNYNELFLGMEVWNIINYGGNHNSDFADMALNSNNCYLSSAVINNNENVCYSMSVKDFSKNVFNCVAIWNTSENIYLSSSVVNSFKVYYSRFINNSSNIWFSTNLDGCTECLLCKDLQNGSYYIENQKYSQEEYFQKKTEILRDKSLFLDIYKKLDTIGKNVASENVFKASAIFNSENIENGYYGYNLRNGRNLILVGGVDGNEDMYDVFPGGSPYANNFYAVMGANGEHLYCSQNITLSSYIFYSYNCQNSSFLIGCIGLKNKSYCILNKQYTKEEWYKKADEIFSQMERDGTLGDFFPGELNPFYFNDTMAGLLGDFTKEEVEARGYMWRDKEIKVDIPEGSEVITTSDLGDYQGYDEDGNWKINPAILTKVIVDEKGNYYRIVQMEYDFLVKHELPLPEIHWMDRMKLNFGI